MKVYINSVIYNRSLADGPGVRTVVFFQGCDIRCDGCHNPSTWNIDNGKAYEVKQLAKELKQNSINGKVTISGGEPLMQKKALSELIRYLKGMDIVLYTGHEEKDVPKDILSGIKYLKTGRYDRNRRTSTVPYIGSDNQKFRRV